jgi:hypothetical protein
MDYIFVVAHRDKKYMPWKRFKVLFFDFVNSRKNIKKKIEMKKLKEKKLLMMSKSLKVIPIIQALNT